MFNAAACPTCKNVQFVFWKKGISFYQLNRGSRGKKYSKGGFKIGQQVDEILLSNGVSLQVQVHDLLCKWEFLAWQE